MRPRGNVFGRALGRLDRMRLHAKTLGKHGCVACASRSGRSDKRSRCALSSFPLAIDGCQRGRRRLPPPPTLILSRQLYIGDTHRPELTAPGFGISVIKGRLGSSKGLGVPGSVFRLSKDRSVRRTHASNRLGLLVWLVSLAAHQSNRSRTEPSSLARISCRMLIGAQCCARPSAL